MGALGGDAGSEGGWGIMAHINPSWQRTQKEKILHTSEEGATFEPVIVSYNLAAKWLVMQLLGKGLKPKVEQLGAGVKRISIVGRCCPICGKGDGV